MASHRHAIDIFDPEVAREHTRAELASKYGTYKRDKPFTRTKEMDEAEQRHQEKMRAALAEEAKLRREREEERRRREPGYRADAVELSMTDLLPFDAGADYYKTLEESEFASQGELKAAYKRLSLENHPDKQTGKSAVEISAAAARFDQVCKAYEILSDLPTRRAYAPTHRDSRSPK